VQRQVPVIGGLAEVIMAVTVEGWILGPSLVVRTKRKENRCSCGVRSWLVPIMWDWSESTARQGFVSSTLCSRLRDVMKAQAMRQSTAVIPSLCLRKLMHK